MALEEQRKLANDCIQGAEAGSTDQEVGPGESQLHLSLNSREEAYVCMKVSYRNMHYKGRILLIERGISAEAVDVASGIRAKAN